MAESKYDMVMDELIDMLRQQAEHNEQARKILQAYDRGFARGLALAGERNAVLRTLRRRFGELPEAVIARVNAANLATVLRYSERAFDAASPEEVVADG